MATIIIFVVIGILIGIYNAYSDYDSSISLFIGFPFIGAIVGFCLGFGLTFILPMKTYDKHYSLNIENLQDNNGVKGSFYLGCGQFKDNMKYVFYYSENGLFKMEQVDYNKASIKISNGRPKVNVTEIYPVEDAFINYFAYDDDIYSKTYVIEVPQGTIKNNYNLDAN